MNNPAIIKGVQEVVQHVTDNPKIAGVVAASTTATGAGRWLDWIPEAALTDIGLLVGIVLSIVLIFRHVVLGILEFKKMRAELELTRSKHRQLNEGAPPHK